MHHKIVLTLDLNSSFYLFSSGRAAGRWRLIQCLCCAVEHSLSGMVPNPSSGSSRKIVSLQSQGELQQPHGAGLGATHW